MPRKLKRKPPKLILPSPTKRKLSDGLVAPVIPIPPKVRRKQIMGESHSSPQEATTRIHSPVLDLSYVLLPHTKGESLSSPQEATSPLPQIGRAHV